MKIKNVVFTKKKKNEKILTNFKNVKFTKKKKKGTVSSFDKNDCDWSSV